MEEKWQKLKEWVDESSNIVFFGGAGVSTESGIPDFRSVDGLYNQKYKYPPETIISHSFYVRNPTLNNFETLFSPGFSLSELLLRKEASADCCHRLF